MHWYKDIQCESCNNGKVKKGMVKFESAEGLTLDNDKYNGIKDSFSPKLNTYGFGSVREILSKIKSLVISLENEIRKCVGTLGLNFFISSMTFHGGCLTRKSSGPFATSLSLFYCFCAHKLKL